MNEREVLEGAVQILRENHWCKDFWRRDMPHGAAYCLAGACYESAGVLQPEGVNNYDVDEYSPNFEAADAALVLLAQRAGQRSVEGWNDEVAEDVEEVLALVEETLKSMDIGVEEETIVIEPLVEPIPDAEPAEAPAETPVPQEEPVLVPA